MKKLAMSALLGAVVLASANASATVINFASLGLAEGQSVQGSTFSGVTFTGQSGTLIYTGAYGAGLYDGFGAANDITLRPWCSILASPPEGPGWAVGGDRSWRCA